MLCSYLLIRLNCNTLLIDWFDWIELELYYSPKCRIPYCKLSWLNWNYTFLFSYYLLPLFTVQIIEYVVVYWFGFYFYLQSKCRRFCDHYTSIAPEDRLRFLTTLSKQYGVNQEAVVQVARSVVSAQVRNHHGKIGNTAEISAKPTLKLHNW